MRSLVASLLAAMIIATSISAQAEEKGSKVLEHKMKAIDGKEVNLAEKYKGKVLVVVNVASQCGLTPQYKQLESLQDKYHGKGLEVVGFPCNQFGGQDPGSNDEIAGFCQRNYGVDFPMAGKRHVRGPDADPLFRWLAREGGLLARPMWNFHKYLIARDGHRAFIIFRKNESCKFFRTGHIGPLANHGEVAVGTNGERFQPR